MSMKLFGRLGNIEVNLYTLENEFIKVEVLDYGATVRSLVVNHVDVVCSFEHLQEYIKGTSYHGAVVGRYANRIADGAFALGGINYRLNKNEKGIGHLHGGNIGFDKRIWNMIDYQKDSLTLSLSSPDGEEGYPGNLEVKVTYMLIDKGLVIHYAAECDRDTPLNLTNHSYFNLNGIGSGDIYSHVLKINSDFYDEVDKQLIPTGKASVDGTPFDFRMPKAIGRDINEPHPQLLTGGGYDHNFYLSNKNIKTFNGKTLKEAAILSADQVKMSVYTDMPCIQLYTGNFMTDLQPFKGGIPQQKQHALCLETQYAPNSPNRGEAILKANEVYDKTTVFEFE